MKNRTHVMLNMLLAIFSIVLLIMGISEELWLLMILGVVCFFLILVLRSRQIAKMNHELDEMKKETPDETDNTENE